MSSHGATVRRLRGDDGTVGGPCPSGRREGLRSVETRCRRSWLLRQGRVPVRRTSPAGAAALPPPAPDQRSRAPGPARRSAGLLVVFARPFTVGPRDTPSSPVDSGPSTSPTKRISAFTTIAWDVWTGSSAEWVRQANGGGAQSALRGLHRSGWRQCAEG